MRTIQRAVAAYYRVSLSALQGRAKDAPVVRARQVSYLLIRELRRLSYPAIGRLLGRNHSSVLTGARKIRQERLTSPELRAEIAELLDSLSELDKRQAELFA